MKWALVAFALVFACFGASREDLPQTASGTFVQKKVLSDMDVTLTSRGEFRFEKDKRFEWRTLSPAKSVFVATPTNYSFTVNGRTSSHPIEVDVSSIEKVFEIKEMRSFVKAVKLTPDTGFPVKVEVAFKNGDRLEMDLVCTK